MPWVRFSDDWYDDPDLVEAGPLAMMLWPLLISWSARNLTDGRVPLGQVARLVDWTDLPQTPQQVIAALVSRERLQEIAGAVQIVNYLEYQPSKDKVLADREAARGRAAKSRERASHVRDECEPGAPPPVPVPVPNSSSSPSALPADLWTKVAEKKAAGISGIRDISAWKRKAAENARTELEDRALSLMEHYELDTSHLVDALLSPTNPPWITHYKRRTA